MYYLQSRYFDPETGRFINADALTSTGQGLLGNNMFAYCNNNPVNSFDPTGEIAITTIILIAAIVAGVGFAGYTAYKEAEAGYDTAQIIGDSICNGVAAFSVVYTCGMSAYQCYQNYCYLNAITPVTDIGSSVSTQLQQCADTANASVAGKGAVVGTKKHTIFATEVQKLGRNDLGTEVSYKNGLKVPYGTKGSIRFDVIQYNAKGEPIAAWDFKTGSACLTDDRIRQMQSKSGLSIPIYTVR